MAEIPSEKTLNDVYVDTQDIKKEVEIISEKITGIERKKDPPVIG